MKFNETVTASSSSGASNVQIEKKMKFNETVTASSSSGAPNVHISDELRVTSGICFSNLTNCNFYFNSK
jgi:hypothetical protein